MIKSNTSYHGTNGYDMDEMIERVVNKFVNDNLILTADIISINTTPTISEVKKHSCMVNGVWITIIYREN